MTIRNIEISVYVSELSGDPEMGELEDVNLTRRFKTDEDIKALAQEVFDILMAFAVKNDKEDG